MSFDHLKSTVHKFNAIKSTVVTVATDLLYKYAMSIKKRTRLNTNGFFFTSNAVSAFNNASALSFSKFLVKETLLI